MTSSITNCNNALQQVEDNINRDYKRIKGELSNSILTGLAQFAKKNTENVPIGVGRMKGNRLEFIPLEYTKNEIEVLHLSVSSAKKKKLTKKSSKDEKKLEKIQKQLDKTHIKIASPSDKNTQLVTLNEKANKLQSEIDHLKNKISTGAEKPLIEKKEDEVIIENLTRKNEIIEHKLSSCTSCIIIHKIIGYKVMIEYKNMDLPSDMKIELDKLIELNNFNNSISFQF